jgi:TonB family protein
MKKIISVACFALLSLCTKAQVTYEEYEVIEEKQFALPRIQGGKQNVEQVYKTQLEIPKSVLSSNYEQDIIVYFTITKDGKLSNMSFDKKYNNFLEAEVRRLMRFFNYAAYNEKDKGLIDKECAFRLKLSAEKFKKYQKFRGKSPIKEQMPKDTSFTIYERADKAPEYYKKGEDGLSDYMLTEISYPSVAQRNNIEGTVVIEFIVEANGYPTNIVVKQGVNGGCSEEAVRLISETKWIPAQKDGKYVRYKMSYPITFSLRNINRDNANGNQAGQ